MLCFSEKERQQSGVSDSCGCLWVYLANLRAADGGLHPHYNPFYDPMKHDHPLLPAAAALAPNIWPQFHLRWACPSEAHTGELESQWRIMSKKYAEMSKVPPCNSFIDLEVWCLNMQEMLYCRLLYQVLLDSILKFLFIHSVFFHGRLQAKELAELKINDLKVNMDSVAAELQKERQVSNSALTMAKRACRESLAIKRAIQSLGCKVHFSSDGSHVIDSGGSLSLEAREDPLYSLSRDSDTGSGQHYEKADLSVSIIAMDDSMIPDNPMSRVCDTLCPFRTGEGCKWPDAGCAQLGSQFVGLKANFDAFDRLSIYDRYFGSE